MSSIGLHTYNNSKTLMISDFQNGLIEVLKPLLNTKIYRGELSEPEQAVFQDSELPLAMVDFVAGSPEAKTEREEFTFNIYLIHLSYSGNEKIRGRNEKELANLIQEVTRTLKNRPISNSSPVELGKLKKLFDARTSEGYMTVFVRSLSVVLYDTENPHLGLNL